MYYMVFITVNLFLAVGRFNANEFCYVERPINLAAQRQHEIDSLCNLDITSQKAMYAMESWIFDALD